MKRYRLKLEAVQFFNQKHATSIYDLDVWQDKLGVDITALEEVEPTVIEHGHKSSESTTQLGGWDEDGGKYHFTIRFPSIKLMEHDAFSNGKTLRELMSRMQSTVDSFYSQFSESETNN